VSVGAILIVAIAGFVLGAVMLLLTSSPSRRRMLQESHERAASAGRHAADLRARLVDLRDERDIVIGDAAPERRSRRFERVPEPAEHPAPVEPR
jgi:hypothetical protein